MLVADESWQVAEGGAPELSRADHLRSYLDHARAVLTDAAAALSPAVLTTYAFGLASAFSDFYEHTPAIVREQDPATRRFRRELVAATRATLADALYSLGMAAPDQV